MAQLQPQGTYGYSKTEGARQGAAGGFAAGATGAVGPAVALAPFTAGLSLLAIPAGGAVGAATGAATGAAGAPGEKFGVLPPGQQPTGPGQQQQSPWSESLKDMLLKYYMHQLTQDEEEVDAALGGVWQQQPSAMQAAGARAFAPQGAAPPTMAQQAANQALAPQTQLPAYNPYGLYDVSF